MPRRFRIADGNRWIERPGMQATVINAANARVAIEQRFTTGSYHVTINEDDCGDHRFVPDKAVILSHGDRAYEIEHRKISTLFNVLSWHVRITEGEQILHEAHHDSAGERATPYRIRRAGIMIQVTSMCAGIGAVGMFLVSRLMEIGPGGVWVARSSASSAV